MPDVNEYTEWEKWSRNKVATEAGAAGKTTTIPGTEFGDTETGERWKIFLRWTSKDACFLSFPANGLEWTFINEGTLDREPAPISRNRENALFVRPTQG